MIRYKIINGVQTIQEICEHCEEVVGDIHVSEIITKKKGDGRILKVENADRILEPVKTKDEKIKEVKARASSSGKLDDSGQELKYGLRAEGFCSQSIDKATNVTSSYCYRVTHPKVTAKFGSLFSDATDYNISGSKKGIRRIKPGESNTSVHLVERIQSEEQSDGSVKYEYPWTVEWVRELGRGTEEEEAILYYENSCSAMRGQAGRYRSYAEWREGVTRYCR